MNKFLLIILFTIQSLNTSAQYGEWEHSDRSRWYSSINICERLPENNLLTVSSVSLDNFSSKIDIFDESGQILNSRILNWDSLNYTLKAFLVGSEKNILLLGTYDSLLSVTILDLELNILRDTVYNLGFKAYFDHLDGVMMEDGNILMAGSSKLVEQFPSGESTMNFFIISKNGDLLSNILINIEKTYFDNCYSIVKSLTDDNFICIGGSKYTIDTSLLYNKIDFTKNGVTAGNQVRVLHWNKEKYIIGSTVAHGLGDNWKEGAVVIFSNTDLKPLQYNGFRNETGFAFPQKTFDYYDRNKIYLGLQEPPPFLPTLGFKLMQLDSSLNRIWSIMVKTDSVTFRMRGLTATTDGGVVTWGAKYIKDAGPFGALTPYMIKFNSNGDLVFAENIDPKDLTILKSFPNPSSGPLTLDIRGITGKADVRIYDMLGRNVYVQDGITEGETTMDLSGLAAGTYIYKIYQGSKEIGSGQWVKM